MEGRQVGSCPKQTLEVLPFVFEHKAKVLVDLTVESVGKDEATLFFVFSDWLQDIQNLLKHNKSIKPILAKITLYYSPTVLV